MPVHGDGLTRPHETVREMLTRVRAERLASRRERLTRKTVHPSSPALPTENPAVEPDSIHPKLAELAESDHVECKAIDEDLIPDGIEAASSSMAEASETPSPEQTAIQSDSEDGDGDRSESSDIIPTVDEAPPPPTDEATSSESSLETVSGVGPTTDEPVSEAQTATTPVQLASPHQTPQEPDETPNIPPLQLAAHETPDAQHDLGDTPSLRFKQRDPNETAPTLETADAPQPSSPESPMRPSTPPVFGTSLDPTRPRTLDFRKTS